MFEIFPSKLTQNIRAHRARNILCGACCALLPGYSATRAIPVEAAAVQAVGDKSVKPAVGKGDEPTADERNIIEDALRLIVAGTGFDGDFILLRATGARASAAMRGTDNVIYFSPQLIEDLRQSENKWIARMILAHEVGHHFFGHTRSRLSQLKKADRELQADRFAGMVIARMKGTLEQLKAGFMTYDEIGRGGYPPREERFAAGRSGWLSVAAPREQLTMSAQGSDGPITSVWRKSGLTWVESIDGQDQRRFEESVRDDEYITLISDDESEILMIPLTDNEVLSRVPGGPGGLFVPVAHAKWPALAGEPPPAVRQAREPAIGPVPVICSKTADAEYPCATAEETAAVSAIQEGTWEKGPNIVYPSGWRYREDATISTISVSPESSSVLARHQFKITLAQGGWTISYGERRRMLEVGDEDLSNMLVHAPRPLADNAPALTPGMDPAASIGAESAESEVEPATSESDQADADGNYVALRYIVFKDGKPCLDGEQTPPQRCGKPVHQKANIPIQEDTSKHWSTTVSLDMQDEKTAAHSDRIFTNDFTCSARRSLSVEALSAVCQTVIEAMTNSLDWTEEIAAEYLKMPPPPPPPTFPAEEE